MTTKEDMKGHPLNNVNMDDNDPNSTTLLIVSTHRKTGGINTTASSAHTNYQYPTIVY